MQSAALGARHQGGSGQLPYGRTSLIASLLGYFSLRDCHVDTSINCVCSDLIMLFVLQQLGQLSEPGVHFLFAAALLKIEIYAAAGTKPLTVGSAEKFRVHVENERCSGEVTQIHFIVFQQYDILVFVKLSFLCENTRVVNRFFLGEFRTAAVTDAVERRMRRQIAQQHASLVLYTAFHIDRLGDRSVPAENQIPEIQRKAELLSAFGGMQQLVDV